MKKGSAVLTIFEKATVPYAGASVEVTWPIASSATTGNSVRSSDHVSCGNLRIATHSQPRPRGSGM